ncbi:hypothetical protein Tco_0751325 [Tanacetum coccineum]|uniref:Uncharacterized protein n=1 Tax=Tanacetum coccineum TaxID=301880 RepID=A0ABQ4Z3R4_9ASTR
MSTFNLHQQSLANAGSKTRPSMLERGSYIPWGSHFRRYLNQKRETRKWLNKAIDDGPYEFRIFTPSDTEAPRMQREEDLRGDDLKHYKVEIEAMNLILISIPNDIYNSVDACTTKKPCGNELNEQNHIIFPPVTVNTKFLICLQPEWLKYVTQVRLAKLLIVDSYDVLFDYIQQFEKLVNASRAKKLEKSHDPFALVAHTGDTVQNNSDDPLTSIMILLARAITRNFSNPTNNHLRTSSNTINQAIVYRELYELHLQELLQMSNATTTVRKNEAGVICTDVQNDFLFVDASRMEEIKELSANICLMARIQPTNIDFEAGPSYNSAFLSEVQTLSSSYVNPLFSRDNQEQQYLKQPKIINNTIGDDQIDTNIIFDAPNDAVNSGSIEENNNVQQSYELEQLARNAYYEAEKQQTIAKNFNNKT